MHRLATITLTVLFIISILLTAYLTYNYFERRDRMEAEAFNTAERQATAAADEISAEFGELMTIADGVADDLSNGELAYEEAEDRLFSITRARPDIDGLAVTWAPFDYDPDQRLYQVYVSKDGDGSFDALRGATYDYTTPPDQTNEIDTTWYHKTINEGAQWLEPFYATGAQKILVEYGVPFYPPGADQETAEPAGIVTIDYTLQDVRQLIRDLELGATGYGFVLSGEGAFLTHPISDYVVNRTFSEVTDDDALLNAVENANGGGRDFVETDNPITGETTWYFFEPIGSTGWTVGIVLNKSQFQPDSRQTVKDQMTIALGVASTIFFGATTIFHVDRYRITNFWAVSGVFSVLCVILIVFAWALTNNLTAREGISISNQSELDRFVQGIEAPPGTTGRPQQIPTGILIQSMQFPDPTAVTINGYVWQRYPTDSDIEPGFTLPQRIGEEVTFEEVQRETQDSEQVIVWYIGVTLRQTYDTTRFPFDHRTINVRMAPGDLNANAILTPDLNAYELINPSLLPGVDERASINNWTLQSSGFSYADDKTNIRFALNDGENGGSLPELRFNVQAQRVYLGPFIAYLLPGLVATAMTFAYLLSGREPGKNDEIVGALNYAAALFFVVAVIHTALRNQIAAVGITYMEHLYILLYLAIIAVAANIFVVARFPHWGIVNYRDNLAPKVLYWPVIAGALLVSTLVIFVY